jgi:hypothetical protein
MGIKVGCGVSGRVAAEGSDVNVGGESVGLVSIGEGDGGKVAGAYVGDEVMGMNVGGDTGAKVPAPEGWNVNVGGCIMGGATGGETGAGDPPKIGCVEGGKVGNCTIIGVTGAALLGELGSLGTGTIGALALLLVLALVCFLKGRRRGGGGGGRGGEMITGSCGGVSGRRSNRRISFVSSLRLLVLLENRDPQSPLQVTTTCNSTEKDCA